MPSAKATRTAGQYLRTFMRANTVGWGEMMRQSLPSKGWGISDAAHDAHEAAMFLDGETDQHFLDFTIPGEFASGAHLLQKLHSFREDIEQYEAKLELHREQAAAAGTELPGTVDLVACELEKCRLGVDHVIGLLNRPTRSTTPGGDIDVLRKIARRFPEVVAELANRRAPDLALVMEDEYDVQYLFQALLRLEFEDVRPEETMPSTAGGSGRADCLLKDRKIIIEFKMTRSGYDAVRLRKELADDFVIYGTHPDCERLFAFVYDPGRKIANRSGVEADLSKPRPPIKEVVTFIQQG
jgi:hypothetical protein